MYEPIDSEQIMGLVETDRLALSRLLEVLVDKEIITEQEAEYVWDGRSG